MRLLKNRDRADSDYRINALLDAIKTRFGYTTDYALCEFFNVHPPVVSKLRCGRMPIGYTLLLYMHEITDIPLKELRALMGDTRPHFRPPVRVDGNYQWEKPMPKKTPTPLSRINLRSFLEQNRSKDITMHYVKKDETKRTIQCRLDVQASKGGENKVEALDRSYLTVYDLAVEEYRTVNLATVSKVEIDGQEYSVAD